MQHAPHAPEAALHTHFFLLLKSVPTSGKVSCPQQLHVLFMLQTATKMYIALDSHVQVNLICREGAITPGALVLCPNAALCQQVKLVADSLTDSTGLPLLQTAHVSSSSPPPFKVPDILVSTPASLINVTQASHYGPEWTRGGILARYTHKHNYTWTLDRLARLYMCSCTSLHLCTHSTSQSRRCVDA